MTVTIRLGCCALALLAASTSWSMGSAEAGAAKSATCLACHGPNGNSSNPEFPSLAGQNAAYIEHQLHLLHDGGRTGKTGDVDAAMMPAMASTVADRTRSRPFLLAGRPAAVPQWRSHARHSGLRGLPRTARTRQSGRRLPGTARPAIRVPDQTAERLQRRRALLEKREGREPRRRHRRDHAHDRNTAHRPR